MHGILAPALWKAVRPGVAFGREILGEQKAKSKNISCRHKKFKKYPRNRQRDKTLKDNKKPGISRVVSLRWASG
jgi:hypothetical protein